MVPSSAVLVVDDDPAIQRLLGRLLRLHRFTPLNASTLSEAIGLLRARDVAAVIVDLGLRAPESGTHVIRWLRAQSRYEQTPIVVLTGQVDLSAEDRALFERERAVVFHKGRSLRPLIDHLREALQQ